MEWIWIAFLVVLLVALVYMWQRSKNATSGTATAKPGMEDGVLTVGGVSPRPMEPDSKNQAFVTLSGTIAGPSVKPTAVYQQLVVDFGARWPEVGDQVPVYYKVSSVESSWRLGSLSPAPGRQDEPNPGDQYPS